MRSLSFDEMHDLRDRQLWQCTEKQMRMVFMAFHCQDLDIVLFTDITDQVLKPGFDSGDQEDFPSISWAKDEMIIDHGYGCFCLSILILHAFIIS